MNPCRTHPGSDFDINDYPNDVCERISRGNPLAVQNPQFIVFALILDCLDSNFLDREPAWSWSRLAAISPDEWQ